MLHPPGGIAAGPYDPREPETAPCFFEALMRVRILVDFWNLQIAWNNFHERQAQGRPRIPWRVRLPIVLTNHVSDEAVYTGCHVYASVDPRNPADAGLRRFLHRMKGFPGYRVTIKERKPRGPYTCQHSECRQPLRECPHCGRPLQGSVEKGVDTALATDLIQAAIDDLFDDAILISADADFVPAVDLVQNRTSKRVIQCPRTGLSPSLPDQRRVSTETAPGKAGCAGKEYWWRRWDSNPRPPECDSGALPS